MKIILDKVLQDNNKYIAYLKLMDGDNVVATKSLAYALGDNEFALTAQVKFKKDISEWKTKQAGLEQARIEIEATLKEIKL
jgi:hypothetical protein